jgi:hypothetical protein
MQPTIKDDFTTVRGYFVALVSLRKDLSVRDHPGYTVQLRGLYGFGSSYSRDIF